MPENLEPFDPLPQETLDAQRAFQEKRAKLRQEKEERDARLKAEGQARYWHLTGVEILDIDLSGSYLAGVWLSNGQYLRAEEGDLELEGDVTPTLEESCTPQSDEQPTGHKPYNPDDQP